jgi:hypothetical protein
MVLGRFILIWSIIMSLLLLNDKHSNDKNKIFFIPFLITVQLETKALQHCVSVMPAEIL